MSNPTNSPSENVKKLESRVEQASKIMKIKPEETWAILDSMGISHDDEGLALLNADTTQEGDARAYFCEGAGHLKSGQQIVPIVRFKAGWSLLKGKAESKSVEAQVAPAGFEAILQAMKTPAQMSDQELLSKYGPDASSETIDELKRRSHDRGFIVFDGSNIDTDTSLKLLRIARRQETPATYKIEGRSNLSRVYRLGEFPMTFVEECPIHADIILVENYCEKCMESWEGISYDDRVLVRVAKNMGAIDVSSIQKVHELVTRLKTEGAKFLLSIPAVELQYSELQAEDKLPNLRRKFSSNRNGKSDPFFVKN